MLYQNRADCIRKQKAAFTVIEIMIAAVLISALFIVTTSLISYVRVNIGRGSWIQGAVSELRNSVRLISDRITRANYPSVIDIRPNQEPRISSFKELRRFDPRGRLIHLETRDNTDDMDLYVRVGITEPRGQPIRLITVPNCSPEIDGDTYQPGMIVWSAFNLERDPATQLGRIRHIEWQQQYNTTAQRDLEGARLFNLRPDFAPANIGGPPANVELIADRIIVNDVTAVNIDRTVVRESRGEARRENQDLGGQIELRDRSVIGIHINTTYPDDRRVTLSDQAIVSNTVDVYIDAGAALYVVDIPGSASALFSNGNQISVGEQLQPPYRHLTLEEVYSDRVRMRHSDGHSLILYRMDLN